MKLFYVFLLVVGVIFVSGCVSQQPNPSQQYYPGQQPNPDPNSPIPHKAFVVFQSNYKLTPDTITVDQGDIVRITKISNIQEQCTLSIPGYLPGGISGSMSFEGNQVITINDFVANKPEKFAMLCGTPGIDAVVKDLGGTFIVLQK